MFSLTPPTRAASICTMSMASSCRSCLKMTRFWACSPVATWIGLTVLRMAACATMSSGLVGSSIQYGSNGASLAIHVIALARSHRRLASIAIRMSGPTLARATRSRRTSSARSAPTFSLI